MSSFDWSSVTLLVGIPVGAQNIEPETMETVIGILAAVRARGGIAEWTHARSLYEVAMGRNLLCGKMLDGDFTHLLQVDADMAFDPDVALRLVERDVDIIGAAGRVKLPEGPPRYATIRVDDAPPERGAVRVHMCGGAVLLTTRSVLRTLAPLCESYRLVTGAEVVGFFDRFVIDGVRVGEDAAFCVRAARSGFDRWCLVDADITHFGRGARPWRGNLRDEIGEADAPPEMGAA